MRCRPIRVLAFAALLSTGGCVSLAEARDHQAVEWDDGGKDQVAVWLSGGSLYGGQPWAFLTELVATPVLIPFETYIALEFAASDDARVAWGPLGWLASLLPGFTCMPMEEHPDYWLHLRDPLHLPAAERERLRRASAGGSVEWLIEQYERSWPGDPKLARHVHSVVTQVELEPGPGG
jgi:hypothetical protein